MQIFIVYYIACINVVVYQSLKMSFDSKRKKDEDIYFKLVFTLNYPNAFCCKGKSFFPFFHLRWYGFSFFSYFHYLFFFLDSFFSIFLFIFLFGFFLFLFSFFIYFSLLFLITCFFLFYFEIPESLEHEGLGHCKYFNPQTDIYC